MSERTPEISDDALIQSILKGRKDDFEVLVSRYEGYVFRLVGSHVPANEVEDLAQEAFIRAYKSLPGYRAKGKGFRPWLASITVRACQDYWRRAYGRRETPISHLTEEHDKWLDSALAEWSLAALEEQGAADRAREILEAGLGRLSAEDRMVLELVYLEGRSGREAAELLNWSTAKVKVRCFRARRKLETFLLKQRRSEGR